MPVSHRVLYYQENSTASLLMLDCKDFACFAESWNEATEVVTQAMGSSDLCRVPRDGEISHGLGYVSTSVPSFDVIRPRYVTPISSNEHLERLSLRTASRSAV
jgi:hypothetical protein